MDFFSKSIKRQVMIDFFQGAMYMKNEDKFFVPTRKQIIFLKIS